MGGLKSISRPQQLLTYFVALGIGLYAYKLEKIK